MDERKKSKSRVESVLSASSLDSSVTEFKTFNLSNLKIEHDIEFELPDNLRLGHLAERVVSELIKSSNNFKLLFENIQIIEDNRTLGELDFIIQNEETDRITHLEMAYKFYLYDPSISENELSNWIGPNRNDSLEEKLNKLKSKQFPLLFHEEVKSRLEGIKIENISQELCLLVSLFVPYNEKIELSAIYANAIKGYYLNYDELKKLNANDKKYYIPTKTEWGINPVENDVWVGFAEVENVIERAMLEKQSVLCWQKEGEVYASFFIVWF